jgi:ABC-type multidrug transport system ATPase subunit
MQIEIQGVGKQYYYNWIFKNLSFTFQKGETYALLGANGSGKSTLMKILAGLSMPTSGKYLFLVDNKEVDPNLVYKHISFTAPYLELIEEFTFRELLGFHAKLKPFILNFGITDVAEISGLEKHLDKAISSFSSGMKQRVKLSLAFLSQSDFVLLDEPSTALDEEATLWYRNLVDNYLNERGLIVSSNRHSAEYEFCTHWLGLPELRMCKRDDNL